jgi:dTMP kinase
MAEGTFISFEGIEGSGKSTQAQRLAERLRAAGREVVTLREPGGTSLGDRIRAILLDRDQVGMEPVAEMLLFAASRAQLIREVVRPALDRGAVVLCDRFLHSSLAYQGHARGLGRERVLAANLHATDGLLPDVVLLLDVPAERSLERALARSVADRFEAEDLAFHRAVRDGFAFEAAADPDRLAVIDGAQPIDAVERAILEALAPRLPEIAP